MYFDVLGPLRVTTCSGVVKVPGGSTAKTLCWLVANLNQPVTGTDLAAALWPDPVSDAPAKAMALARNLVPLLGSSRLSVNGQALLAGPDDAVDANRFSRLVDEGLQRLRDGDPAMAEADLTVALGLWRADPYPELERALPAMALVDGLADKWLTAREELIGLALRRRVGYPLVAELRSLVIRHPARVRFSTQLAIALYRTGRQIEALEVLAAARDRHGNEKRLSVVHTGVLQQAPELLRGELPA